MKKFYLLLLALVTSASVMAESYTLTFIRTGNGAESQIQTIVKDANGNKVSGVTATTTCSSTLMNNRAKNHYYFLTPTDATSADAGITFYVTLDGISMNVRQMNIDTYGLGYYGTAAAATNAAAVNIQAQVGDATQTLENESVILGGQAGIDDLIHKVHSVRFTDPVAISGQTEIGFATSAANTTSVYMAVYSITLSDGTLTNTSELLNNCTYEISGLTGYYAILQSDKGNYYLYDVTNGKFYGDQIVPVTIDATDGVWNISQNGTVIVRGASVATVTTTFDDTEAQDAIYNVENVVAKFQYSYTHEGNVWATVDVQGIVGQDYPEVTAPFGVTATTPEGTITGQETVVEIPVELNGELPFTFAEKDDELEQYYYMNISANGLYLKYNQGDSVMVLNNSTRVDRTEQGNYSFGFVGNPYLGYKIKNYAAGADYILSSAKDAVDGSTGGATYPVMKDQNTLTDADAVHFVAYASDKLEGGFYLENEAGYRMNYRNPNLAYWTGGYDSGSTFRVEMSSAGLEPAEFWTTRDDVIETLTTMQMLPALYDAETVAAKLAEAKATVVDDDSDVQSLIEKLQALPTDMYAQASGKRIGLSNSMQMNNTSYLRSMENSTVNAWVVGSSYQLGADCVYTVNYTGDGAYTLYNEYTKKYIGIPSEITEETTEPSTAIADQSNNLISMEDDEASAGQWSFSASAQNSVVLACENMGNEYNGIALYQNGTVGNWMPSNSLCTWTMEGVSEEDYQTMAENAEKSYEELYYPQEGKIYYLWNDNDTPLYFYNNGDGTIGTAVAPTEGHPKFLWRIGRKEETVCQTIGYHTAGDVYNGYTFQSVLDDQYWAWKSLREEPYGFEILHDFAFVNGAFNLYGNGYSVQEGRFCALVNKYTGAFDQATYAGFSKDATNFSSDYFCTEFTGTILTDQAIAYLALQDKIESCSNFTVGTGLGEYDDFDNAFTNALAAAKAVAEDASIEDIQAASDAIDAAKETLTLNMPGAGFYRIKGGYYDQYINFDGYVEYYVPCYPDDYDASDPGTIIYYNGTDNIVGYVNGYGINSTYALGDAYNEETCNIIASTTGYGKYSLQSNYAGSQIVWGWTNGYLNRGSSQSAPYTEWTIESVDSLPVYFDAEGWGDIYTPVALALPENVRAYAATVSEGNLTATELTGKVIPAGTAVLLRSTAREEYVGLPITDETGSAVGDNDLQGSDKALPYQENQFMLESGKIGKYWEEVPGFRAYVISETMDSDKGGDISGTDAIETIKEAINQSIYFDLNGRRMGSRPAQKGIYVVNGKKVILK